MRKGRNREAKPSEMVGQIIITRPVESYVSFDRGNRVGICFSFLFFFFSFLYFLHAANRCEISPKINTDNRGNDYAATRFPADFSQFLYRFSACFTDVTRNGIETQSKFSAG